MINAQNQSRKIIYKYRDSIAHKMAIEVALTKQKAILANKVIEVNSKLTEESATSFKAVFLTYQFVSIKYNSAYCSCYVSL